MADIAITAANFIPSNGADIFDGVAGEAVTRGQPLYYDSATGRYKKAKADSSTTADVKGWALEDAANGQKIFICRSDPALALGGTLAAGAVIYLSSANAGGVTSTYADLSSGNIVVVLGGGTGSNNVNARTLYLGAKP